MKTTALAEDCVVAELAKLVEEAQNRKSKTQRFVDKFAKFYTPGKSTFHRHLVGVMLVQIFVFNEIVS